MRIGLKVRVFFFGLPVTLTSHPFSGCHQSRRAQAQVQDLVLVTPFVF